MVHTDKGFGIVNKAETDVFLKLSCFFIDPVDVGSLISGSSAFSKSSLYTCRFFVHILLKPSFKDFKYNLAACKMSNMLPSGKILHNDSTISK